jgi:hypothetical protein
LSGNPEEQKSRFTKNTKNTVLTLKPLIGRQNRGQTSKNTFFPFQDLNFDDLGAIWTISTVFGAPLFVVLYDQFGRVDSKGRFKPFY